MADVNSNLDSWSTTVSSNGPTGSTNIGTGLDDNLGQIQATVRKYLATKGADIASSSTTDLSTATGSRVDITGTTTITAFGTLTAGMSKILRFTGILTLTHNASSLILPSGANITTAAGDFAMATSLGSGNWEVNWYQPKTGLPIIQSFVDSNFRVIGSADGTKKLAFEVDSNVPTGTTLLVTTGAGGILPAGIGPLPYAGASIPTGWLECDGSAVSRTTYAALFTAISTTWGVGDGSLTFNLPDCRGRSPVGAGTGTVAESVTDANVTTASDTFTVSSNSTKWITGQPIVLTTTTTLPTGLSLATTYYLIRASATTVKFASSLANAQNGTAIDITAKFGSGTHTLTGTLTLRALGDIGGEEGHAESSTESWAHSHAMNISTLNLGTGGGSGVNFKVAVAGDSTSSAGGNAAMNIMQPFIVTKFIISY